MGSDDLLDYDSVVEILEENEGQPRALLKHNGTRHTIATWKNELIEHDPGFYDLMERIGWRSVEIPKDEFKEKVDNYIEESISNPESDSVEKPPQELSADEFHRAYDWSQLDDRQIAAKCHEWCKENADIIFSNDQVWVLDGDIWVRNENYVAIQLRDLVGEYYGRNVKQEFVEGYVTVDDEYHVPWDSMGLRGPRCVVENGILNLLDGEIEREVVPDDYAVMQFPVRWEGVEAHREQFEEEFLHKSVEREDVKKLQEFAGFCLHTNDYRYKKALMMVGAGDNGKGVFEEILVALVGQANAMHDDLKELSQNQFGAHRLRHNAVNINSDIDGNQITETSTFKKLTGRDRLRVEAKYQEPFEIKNPAKLLFAANEVPEVKNGDHAFYNRWMFVHFPNRFTPFDDEYHMADPDLADEIIEDELPGVLAWAVEGYHRLHKQGHFTGQLPGEEVRDMWSDYADTTATFVNNYVSYEETPQKDVAPTPTTVDQMYRYYKKYISTTPTAPETKQTLNAYIKNRYEDASVEVSRQAADTLDLNQDTVRKWDGVHLSHEAREEIKSRLVDE